MARKICYVSGTRADFGLMRSTLQLLNQHPQIDLSVCTTAMHLSPHYGLTVNDIKAAGLRICAEIPVEIEATTQASMAKAIGKEIVAMTEVFEKEQPDIVLLLGDRGEMLAAAIAALHLNIHIVHIHGGERSGTVDELVRHAISKLSHFHFTATKESRERLIKMGEITEHVFVTGAPGLDEMLSLSLSPKEELFSQVNFDPQRPSALFIYHPVVQEIQTLENQVHEILNAALTASLQLICLTPNADAGGKEIQKVLEAYRSHPEIRIYTHMPRNDYLSWMSAVDVMLGNSSSAIIEAASFNLTAINIGTRQHLREHGENIIHSSPYAAEISVAINKALSMRKPPMQNIYGDGLAGKRMVELLLKLPLTKNILEKANVY